MVGLTVVDPVTLNPGVGFVVVGPGGESFGCTAADLAVVVLEVGA